MSDKSIEGIIENKVYNLMQILLDDHKEYIQFRKDNVFTDKTYSWFYAKCQKKIKRKANQIASDIKEKQGVLNDRK